MDTHPPTATNREILERQIQEQLARASELLQQAANLEQSGDADMAEIEEVQARQVAEREHYRGVFSSMLDEVTTMQGTAERLARTLVDVIEDIERTLGPDPELVSLPISSARPPIATDDSPDLEPEEDVLLDETASLGAEANPDGPGMRTVLIHGLDSASKALSFKRYVEGLPAVENVSTHEFAAGVLRLDITSAKNLDPALIADWKDAGKLKIVRDETGLVEVSL